MSKKVLEFCRASRSRCCPALGTPQEPRLNTDVANAVRISQPKFQASPACKSFKVVDTKGNELSLEDLENAEWTALEDLAEPPPNATGIFHRFSNNLAKLNHM